MMYRIISVFIFFSIVGSAYAISFEKAYSSSGAYNANCVRQTFDGGYLMFGSSYNSTNQQQVVIIKTDSNGVEQYLRDYGGALTDGATSSVMTNDSNFIVVGVKDGSINSKIWILKVNQNGDTLWTKTMELGLGTNFPTEVIKTVDNGFVICGYTSAQSMGGLDAFLIKIDSVGNIIWTKTYGGNNSDEAYSVKEMADSGFILAANSASFGLANAGIYLIKTNNIGDTLWSRIINGATLIRVNSMIVSSAIYLGGYSWDTLSNNYRAPLITQFLFPLYLVFNFNKWNCIYLCRFIRQPVNILILFVNIVSIFKF